MATLLCHGQNSQLIRSLKNQLETASGPKKFELLNKIAWEYRWAHPDSTLLYADNSYKLGVSLGLTSGLAQPVNYKGVAENYKGNKLAAFGHFSDALTLATTQNDTLQIAHANNNLGRLFFEQGLLSKAYDYFRTASELFEKLNDKSGLAYSLQSLANLYMSQHDYTKSEINYNKANKLRLELKVTRDIMSGWVQTARLYQTTNQHQKAVTYFLLADSAGRVIDDKINLAELNTLLARSYLALGEIVKAEKICRDGIAVIEQLKNVRMKPQAYLTLGQILLQKKDFAGAQKILRDGVAISERIQSLNSTMDLYLWLWKLSVLQGNKVQAIVDQNMYLVLKDSVNDLDVARQVERFQFQREIERKDQENNILKANLDRDKAEIKQKQLENLLLILSMAGVTFILYLTWRNNRKRSAINKQLELQNAHIQEQRREILDQNEKLSRRNQELSEINLENETLTSIVVHDLKSPLNRIKGIYTLMIMEGGLSAKHLQLLEIINETTREGLVLIKDLLDINQNHPVTETTPVTFNLSDFLYNRLKSFETVASAKFIDIVITEVCSDPVVLDQDQLGRILDNLLSNAIKFSANHTEVKIGAGIRENTIWLRIQDQGPGFSELDKVNMFKKFRKLSARPTGSETSNGLGLAIVKSLVDRMHGTIELQTQPGKGSTFILTFPQENILKID